MKRSKISWLFFLLQIIFMLVAPCVMVWTQYGGFAQRYKVSITAVIILILIFLTFKKIFLNKWLKTFEIKIVNIETNALSITDSISIQNNKKAWRFYSLMQLFFNSIIPFLVMIIGALTVKTLEQGLIKLYGCLMFCLMSIGLGVIFRVAEIYSVKLKNEK